MKSSLITIALGLSMAGTALAASYTPVALTQDSYSDDLIVESNATPALRIATTATLDNGTNNTADTWMEVGNDPGNPTFGFPAHGSTVTSGSYSFTMAPDYTQNNGILVDTVTGGTWTFSPAAIYQKLSFLGSGGNGGDIIGVVIHHADSSVETYNPSAGVTNFAYTFGSPDWFNGSSNVAFIANERMNSVTHTFDNVNSSNPRLYFRDIVVTNTGSAVTRVDLVYVSGAGSSHNDIVAVSGSADGTTFTPITVTGYNADFVIESNSPIRGQVVSQVIIAGTNVFATTQTMDNTGNTGFTYYEKGYNFNNINNQPFTSFNLAAIAQSTGLPHPGQNMTNPAGDHIYTMAPSYTTNNVCYVSPAHTNATITFVTPTAASALSFLDAAGNGPRTCTIVIHHQDSSTETNVITVVDWFSGTTPVYVPGGRVNVSSGQFSQCFLDPTTSADRVFNNDVVLLNSVSPVTSIDLNYTNTDGRIAIFAISSTTGAVAPIIVTAPQGTNTYAGTTASFSVSVAGTAPFFYQWQKATNGVFGNLSDSGDVTGSQTSTLNFSSANYSVDGANYRVIVTNSVGSVTSSIATLTLLSTLTDITQPGDTITDFGAANFGDGANANAIDDSLGTKWGADFTGPPGSPTGLIITPAVGATVVTALRVYTANDTTGRDPADYKLEGSITGPNGTYTLIASNSMTLPDGRNTAAVAPDPLTSFLTEVSFPNTAGYTTYRLTFSHYKGGATQTQVQLGELELLGVTTNLPVQVNVPSVARAYVGSSLTINATVSGSPSPDTRWQKLVSGNYVFLSDVGTISGSHTASLTINPTAFSDATSYRIIATNNLAAVTSGPVVVSILSTLVDITQPGDLNTNFGNADGAPANSSSLSIDDTFTPWQISGHGLNAQAGFAPFGGPVGLIITPGVGSTRVNGVRFYSGSDPSVDDPADYTLEGSKNGGASYTLIASGALSMPDDRNDVSLAVDPLTAPGLQEILFNNSQTYTSYRVTFNHVKNDSSANRLSLGEVELLGVGIPSFNGVSVSGGNINLSGSGGTPNGTFSVLTSANVAAPVSTWTSAVSGSFDGSGNFSLSIPINPANPHLFYLIRSP